MTTTPEIVIGSPGTGKTTALLNIMEEELNRGTPPDRIGFLSFTRQAAGVAVERACARFKLAKTDLPWVRTLHSLAYRALGLARGDVLEGAKLQEFAAYAGVRITGRWSDDGTFTGMELGDRALFMENLARVRCVPLRRQYDADPDDLPWDQVERISRALAAFKAAKGLVDYTDMLYQAEATGALPRLEVLICDEQQDCSEAQWKLIFRLAEGCKRFVIGGDDDQAIFEWAGASANRLIELPGKVTVLERSNRVPVNLQPLAETVIRRVRKRRPKTWLPRLGDPGSISRAGHFAQADVAGDDVLVLARNTYVLKDQVEPELRRRGVVYERNGHPSVKAGVLEAIRTWEALRAGKAVPLEAARATYEQMSSGMGVARGHKRLEALEGAPEVTLDTLKAQGGLLASGPWFEALDRLPGGDVGYVRTALARGEKLRPRVRLSTIHGAKGAEASKVILLREMARRTHREMEKEPDAEARVWYVSVTRAKEHLTIVESSTNLRYPWV